LTIYAFASGISKSFLGKVGLDLTSGFLLPLAQVVASLILGAVIGGASLWIIRRIKYPEDLILVTAFIILLISGLAERFHLSALLANMAGAAVIVNRAFFIKRRIEKVFADFAIVFYALFFITAGAHLDLGRLPQIGILGMIFFVTRCIGKVSGAQLGAVLGKAGPTVRKNIGFSLLPQVGVAVALALVVGKEFGTGEYGQEGRHLAEIVVNILLFTTILTEILGPYMTRRALIRAGEARLLEPIRSVQGEGK